MPSVASPSTAVLASAAALSLVAFVAAAYSFGPSSSGRKQRDLKEIEDVDDVLDVDDEFITEQEVVKIFERLFLEMQGVLAQLSQQIQAIQASGQIIPEKQLRQLLKAELERALLFKQNKVCEEYNIDEDCLEEATLEFLQQENPKVKKAVENFQRFWETVTGESVTSSKSQSDARKKDISQETMLEAAEVYFDALTNCMKELVDDLRKAGKDLSQRSVAEELQMLFSSVANEMGEQALKHKLDLSITDFQRGIEFHAADPEIARALNILRMRQQEQLVAMGVPMMML